MCLISLDNEGGEAGSYTDGAEVGGNGSEGGGGGAGIF